MSREVHVEIGCDECSGAAHYPSGASDTYIRSDGWIITRDGKHFCSPSCRKKFIDKEGEG